MSRFTVVAGKKIFARATARNRAKRLVREALRAFLPRLEKGFDGVFIFLRKPDETLQLEMVSREIEHLLQNAKLLKRV